jgi:hypothetical protein
MIKISKTLCDKAFSKITDTDKFSPDYVAAKNIEYI